MALLVISELLEKLLVQQDYVQLLRIAEAALKTHPTYAVFRHYHINTLVQLTRNKEALTSLDVGIQLSRETSDIESFFGFCKEKGNFLMSLDLHEAAVDCFSMIISHEQFPNARRCTLGDKEAQIFRLRATALYSLGRYAEALSDINKFIEISASAEAYHGRGILLLAMNLREEAVLSFIESFKLEPSHAETNLQLRRLLNVTEDQSLEDAVKTLIARFPLTEEWHAETLLRFYPSDSDSWGTAYTKLTKLLMVIRALDTHWRTGAVDSRHPHIADRYASLIECSLEKIITDTAKFHPDLNKLIISYLPKKDPIDYPGSPSRITMLADKMQPGAGSVHIDPPFVSTLWGDSIYGNNASARCEALRVFHTLRRGSSAIEDRGHLLVELEDFVKLDYMVYTFLLKAVHYQESQAEHYQLLLDPLIKRIKTFYHQFEEQLYSHATAKVIEAFIEALREIATQANAILPELTQDLSFLIAEITALSNPMARKMVSDMISGRFFMPTFATELASSAAAVSATVSSLSGPGESKEPAASQGSPAVPSGDSSSSSTHAASSSWRSPPTYSPPSFGLSSSSSASSSSASSSSSSGSAFAPPPTPTPLPRPE
ncbi:hypothetical protein BH10PSE19_BH10PSE19_06510 [soil metagenome]